MNPRVIFWDFDSTLAYRDGMWSGTLVEIQHSHVNQHININYYKMN